MQLGIATFGWFALVACEGSEGKDAAGEEPATDEWRLEEAQDSCATSPDARRFAQTAFWHEPAAPLVLTGSDGLRLPISRGVFLFGGISGDQEADATVYRDLWLYDLHNRRDCPWVLVDDDAGLGAWAGALVVKAGELLLVGGEAMSPVGRSANAAFWSYDLGAGGPGVFVDEDGESLYPEELAFSMIGDPYCQGSSWWCFDPADETVIEVAEATDPCTGSLTLQFGVDNYLSADGHTLVDCTAFSATYDTSGCVFDPYCQQGESPAAGDFQSIGRAHAASYYDDELMILRLFGGTDGSDGPNVDEAWAFTDPLGGDGQLHAGNLDGVATILLFSTPPESDTDESEPFSNWARSSEWPGATSTGVRDLAVVPMGRQFDRATLAWLPHDGEVAVVGGTRHQQATPEQQYHLPGEQPCMGPSGTVPCDVPDAGTFEATTDVPDPFDAEAMALPVALLDADGTIDEDPAWARAAGRRVAPAAVAVEPRAFVVIGGFDTRNPYPVGSSEVTVVDASFGGEVGVDVRGSFAPRFGASAVWDPVTQEGWVFGGTTSDAKVWTLSSVNSIAPNEDSTWAMDDVELSLVRDGVVWHVQAGFRARHHCARDVFEEPGSALDPSRAEDCFADELTLLFPGLELPLALTATVGTIDGPRSTFTTGEVAVEVVAGDVVRDEFRSFATGSLRLPLPVPDGGTAVIVASFDISVADAPGNGVPGLGSEGYGAYDTTTGAGAAQQVVGLPILVAWSAAEPVTRALVDLRATQAATTVPTVFGPGELVDCGPDLFDLLDVGPIEGSCRVNALPLPGSKYAWTALEGVTLAAERDTGHTILRIWVDDTLETELATSLGGAASTIDADLDWLVDHLGPWPGPITQDVVYVSFPAAHGPATGVVAEALPGAVFVSAFDQEVWQPVTLHELAHTWWGIGRSAAPGAQWLTEAVPSLLQTMRYPFVQDSRTRLEAGLTQVVSDGTDSETALENNGDPYLVGALTLASFHASLRSLGASDDEVMEVVRGLLSSAPTMSRSMDDAIDCGRPGTSSVRAIRDARPTVTHDDLVGALVANGLPNFHCEMVHFGRVGFPLLGVATYDNEAPDVGVEVRQVQDRLLGWPLFSDVPYHLLCEAVVPDIAVPTACTGTEADLLAPPRLLGEGAPTASERVELGADEQTLYLGVLTADQLLPELAEPWNLSVGLDRTATLLLRCAPGDLAAPCDIDLDDDGVPTEGDCDDTDPTRGPSVDMGEFGVDGSESVVLEDLNCDGWPTPRFPGAP